MGQFHCKSWLPLYIHDHTHSSLMLLQNNLITVLVFIHFAKYFGNNYNPSNSCGETFPCFLRVTLAQLLPKASLYTAICIMSSV